MGDWEAEGIGLAYPYGTKEGSGKFLQNPFVSGRAAVRISI